MALLKSNTIIHGTANIQGQLIVGSVSSNASINTATGSLIVVGGAGVSGNLYTSNIILSTTSSGITFGDGTIQTTAGIAADQTARTTANTATIIGQAAFAQANSAAQLIPQTPQTNNYILQLSDVGKHIYYTQATSSTLYIPPYSSAAFANGSTVMIISQTSASANVTVTPNTGVSLFLAGSSTSASRNVTTYGMAYLIQVAANTWFINGTGVV
jgi:hypothetical protein